MLLLLFRTIISTPHGLAAASEYSVYCNKEAKGTAEWNGEFEEYRASVHLDGEFSLAFVEKMNGACRARFVGLTCFSTACEAPLRWGEVVPIHFVERAFQRSQQRRQMPMFCVLCLPTKRVDAAVEMIPELDDISAPMLDLFQTASRRIVLLLSADLAHTHEISGPARLWVDKPYGSHDSSANFDAACEKWLSHGSSCCDEHALLVECASLYRTALSCGFTGLLLLHFLVKRFNAQQQDHRKKFVSSLLANKHPTYYGQMVAAFLLPEEEKWMAGKKI